MRRSLIVLLAAACVLSTTTAAYAFVPDPRHSTLGQRGGPPAIRQNPSGRPLPVLCKLSGGPVSATTSHAFVNSVDVSWMGVTCPLGAIGTRFHIDVFLWSYSGTGWVWTERVGEPVTSFGLHPNTIAPGSYIAPCAHGVPVMAKLAYFVGDYRAVYQTNVTTCS